MSEYKDITEVAQAIAKRTKNPTLGRMLLLTNNLPVYTFFVSVICIIIGGLLNLQKGSVLIEVLLRIPIVSFLFSLVIFLSFNFFLQLFYGLIHTYPIKNFRYEIGSRKHSLITVQQEISKNGLVFHLFFALLNILIIAAVAYFAFQLSWKLLLPVLD